MRLSFRFQDREDLARGDHLPQFAVGGGHVRRERRGHRVLHLHRLHDRQSVPDLDALAWPGGQANHDPRHRGPYRAVALLSRGRFGAAVFQGDAASADDEFETLAGGDAGPRQTIHCALIDAVRAFRADRFARPADPEGVPVDRDRGPVPGARADLRMQVTCSSSMSTSRIGRPSPAVSVGSSRSNSSVLSSSRAVGMGR